MNIQNNTNNKTIIQNEQQFKSTNEIIDEIIRILAENVISISNANYILEEASKKLYRQPVIVIGEDVKKIYRMRNKGIIES